MPCIDFHTWHQALEKSRVHKIPRKMITDRVVYVDGERLVHKKRNPAYKPALAKVRKTYKALRKAQVAKHGSMRYYYQ